MECIQKDSGRLFWRRETCAVLRYGDEGLSALSYRVQGYNVRMAVIVSLRDMVDELQTLTHESNAYLKKFTGKVITIRDDDFDMVRSAESAPAHLPLTQAIGQAIHKIEIGFCCE